MFNLKMPNLLFLVPKSLVISDFMFRLLFEQFRLAVFLIPVSLNFLLFLSGMNHHYLVLPAHLQQRFWNVSPSNVAT